MSTELRIMRQAARCAAMAKAFTLMARASLWIARADGDATCGVHNARVYRALAKDRRARARELVGRAFL